MKMGRYTLGFAIVMLLCAIGFSADLTCDDGTKYDECSSVRPGYYCGYDGPNAAALQKVVGEVNDASHPTKAGKPTDLALRCACDKISGYTEVNKECVSAGQPAPAPPPAPTPITPAPVTQPNTTVTPTPINNTRAQTNTSEPATVAPIKTTTEQKTQTVEGFKLGTFEIAVILVVLSIVGGVGLIIVILVAVFVLYKMKKK